MFRLVLGLDARDVGLLAGNRRAFGCDLVLESAHLLQERLQLGRHEGARPQKLDRLLACRLPRLLDLVLQIGDLPLYAPDFTVDLLNAHELVDVFLALVDDIPNRLGDLVQERHGDLLACTPEGKR